MNDHNYVLCISAGPSVFYTCTVHTGYDPSTNIKRGNSNSNNIARPLASTTESCVVTIDLDPGGGTARKIVQEQYLPT